MNVRRVLIALVIALSFVVTPSVSAGGQKTVHVKEYKKQDGTVVKAHDRKPPESKTEKVEKSKKESTAKEDAAVARDDRGHIKRSEAAKHAFEIQTGYPHGRPGYVIDHRIPLACGGKDDPSNMQWQTVAEAKAKDKVERKGC